MSTQMVADLIRIVECIEVIASSVDNWVWADAVMEMRAKRSGVGDMTWTEGR